ncbi:hypothetical protein [Corynebacterium guangdongense]|uniref:Uncharacterized protein n=2 Tax=Corynebacterium guangdongense TaxID=1783348 RepID=A0ABU2A0P7_9CORY|nr:hypothetical protein [Corynebacterium guangdongense]MDR7330208.1 hypothetical protein [Corynebacterium guangdongense]
MFDVRAVRNWIESTDPAEVDRMLWTLRMYAHENCDGFSDLSAALTKQTKAQRERELREATELGKQMNRRNRIRRTAEDIAEAA